MRELIEGLILGSTYWQVCCDNGMENEMPDVRKLSNHDLLELYDFALNHYSMR